ncbi:MAG TPA: hypothetical protein VGU45_17775 [Microvirga sp.]|jgi:hypothetical protein|nr:hypothetical protein [Microvirga sp.]
MGANFLSILRLGLWAALSVGSFGLLLLGVQVYDEYKYLKALGAGTAVTASQVDAGPVTRTASVAPPSARAENDAALVEDGPKDDKVEPAAGPASHPPAAAAVPQPVSRETVAEFTAPAPSIALPSPPEPDLGIAPEPLKVAEVALPVPDPVTEPVLVEAIDVVSASREAGLDAHALDLQLERNLSGLPEAGVDVAAADRAAPRPDAPVDAPAAVTVATAPPIEATLPDAPVTPPTASALGEPAAEAVAGTPVILAEPTPAPKQVAATWVDPPRFEERPPEHHAAEVKLADPTLGGRSEGERDTDISPRASTETPRETQSDPIRIKAALPPNPEPAVETGAAPREVAARELAETYLAAWSGQAASAEDLARFYGATVRFHGKRLSREQLLTEKRRFIERWPQRSYTLKPDSMRVRCDSRASICSVRSLYDYRVANQARGRKGSGREELLLRVAFTGSEPVIIDETSPVQARKPKQTPAELPVDEAQVQSPEGAQLSSRPQQFEGEPRLEARSVNPEAVDKRQAPARRKLNQDGQNSASDEVSQTASATAEVPMPPRRRPAADRSRGEIELPARLLPQAD